jgi:hypothetical protein
MDLFGKSLERLERKHDYRAIVLEGGRCRANYGFVGILVLVSGLI